MVKGLYRSVALAALSAAVLVSFWTAGCGGGKKPSSITAETSSRRVRVGIAWAERTRALASAPNSALSAVIRVKGASASAPGSDVLFTANRDAGNLAAHEATYESDTAAFVGDRRFEVTFYAGQGGAGAVVGTASATLKISEDGAVPGTITNVSRAVASVEVVSGQSLTVGEDRYLSFTARDASGAVIAVSAGSARFATTTDSLVRVTGDVARGVGAGSANVTATVDGVTSPPAPLAVQAPVRIAYIANGQDATVISHLQLLAGRGIVPTRFDSVPDAATLAGFDVLAVSGTGNIGAGDAARVEAFVRSGRGAVLFGGAPAVLANGGADENGDLSAIAPWFGGATRIDDRRFLIGFASLARTAPGLFPLPPGFAPGQKAYDFTGNEAEYYIPSANFVNPATDRVLVDSDGNARAFAYELPASGGSAPGRVYWQFAPYGQNPDYADRILTLFIAGTNWTARR